MNPQTSEYALLSQDAYKDTEVNKQVELGGITYRVMAAQNDPLTGFQAQAYVREDVQPHQVIVAFRGTEFDRQPVRDGGVDAAMVLRGVNLQTSDALAFTQKVVEEANKRAQEQDRPAPNISVTGHSLGGTLAEIAASRYGLYGETFNAYGAAGLREGVPKGGSQFIDHVRAGDLVSAASPHFGEVRIYAAQQDIDTLSKAGYTDYSGITSPRNPIKATNFDAHAIDNFVPNSKLLGQSIISPENEARYRAHGVMVDRYRSDVMDIRLGLSASWEVPKAIGEGADYLRHKAGEGLLEAGRHAAVAAHDLKQGAEHVGREIAQGATAVGHAVHNAAHNVAETATHVRDEVSKDLHAAGDAIGRGASGAWNTVTHPSSWFGDDKAPASKLDHPSHPDHALFRQALTGVHQIDARHQRTPDAQSSNIAGVLTTEARRQGMERIDHVVMNADASRTYAVQGPLDSPLKRVAEVHTASAVNTPLEKSSEQWQQAVATQQSAQASHVRQAAPSQTPPPAPTL